jgi:hypothetical protein
MFDPMDRFYELENWRRSLVMLPPGSRKLRVGSGVCATP